jgi:Spy/CpxP family protein refolding chaperone
LELMRMDYMTLKSNLINHHILRFVQSPNAAKSLGAPPSRRLLYIGLVVLSLAITLPVSNSPADADNVRYKVIAQANADDNNDDRMKFRKETQSDDNSANESARARRLREWKERMRQNATGGSADESDMPGWKMRQRMQGQGGEFPFRGGDGPGRQFRGGGDGGPGGPGGGPGGFGGGPGGPGAEDMSFRRRGQGGFQPGMMQNFRAGGAGMGRGQAGFGGHALDLTPLSLSDEQKEKIKAMREQTRGRIKELRKGVNDKQNEMKALLFNPDASESQIRAARASLRKLQDQMDETNMNDLLSIRAMLTPEQKKRLPECMPGRNNTANGAGPGFGPGGPGFGGPGGPGGPGFGPPGGPGGPDGQVGMFPHPPGPGGFADAGNESTMKRRFNRDRSRKTLEAENDNATSK